MKKTKIEPTKTAKTSTPAVPAPAPEKKVAAKKKVIATPVAAPIPVVAAPPAVKPVPRSPLVTTVIAQIDVGFGNALYLRGEGPGLSWEKGVPLDCVADDKWSIAISGTSKPIVLKFLINDLTWCAGDDFIVQPGASLTVTPIF